MATQIKEFDSQDWDCYNGAESFSEAFPPLIRYSGEEQKIMWVLIGAATGVEVMLVDANGGEHGIFHLDLPKSPFLVESIMKNFPDSEVDGIWLIANGFTQIM